MNPQRLRLFGVGLTVTACTFSAWHAEQLSAEVKFFGKKPAKPAAAAASDEALEKELQQIEAESARPSNGSAAPSSSKTIKMSYISRTWDDVLNDVAKQSGRQLVIDKVPPGRFSRNDWSKYSLDETLRIFNRELEPKGYRLLARGKFLDLVAMSDARSEYARPVVAATTAAPTKAASKSAPPKSATPSPRRDSRIQQANFEEMDDDNDDGEELELPEVTRRWVEVLLKKQSAQIVSRALYQAFEQDAEMIEQGPNGFPGFVVWRDLPTAGRGPMKNAPKRIARFAIGIDAKKNRLMIDGPQAEVATVKGLIAKLDIAATANDRSTRLISTKRDAKQVSQTLNSAVKQLAQLTTDADEDQDAAADAAPKAKTKKSTKKAADTKPAAPAKKPADARGAKPELDPEMEAPADKSKPQGFGGPLKADVSIEELGDVLIIRGNEQDVAIVEKLIVQIESMLAGSVPDVNVRPLQHVDSESLAELLSTVYERLNRSRGRSASDQTQQIVVIAMGKPNAVMVLAAERDMPTVDKLIDQLDQPVDPSNEFEVFRLKYAVASQILTAIDSFFSGSGGSSATGGNQPTTNTTTSSSRSTSGGLRGRVKAISDSRTNSVIVQARPRDLEEVRRLIDELDQVGSQAVNQIKLIPLKNAVADEMSELLNLAIQSVISPPQQVRTQQSGGGGGFGGGFGGGGGQGQVDQKLRDAKSAVLQLLDTEDGEQMLESGVLSDIRINADLRTNSLVVTAPTESLALIQALVKRFDQPASLVAEIKHFSLTNADAQSVTTMLNSLFNNQQQNQGGRGGANQQQQQLGVQLAGAEDASSQLIPLRLSTDVRTNSIIAVGGSEALSVVEAIILRLDADNARQRKMTAYRMKNSDATTVATAMANFLQSQSNLATQGNQGLISNFEQFEREVIVVAETTTNSLLISATPQYYEEILKIVEKIDMDQQQVVIQALLVEVELTNNDEFGVELGLQDSLLFNRGATSTTSLVPGFNFNNAQTGGASSPNSNAGPNARPGQVAGQGLSNFALNRNNTDLGFGGLVLSAGSESVSVLLRALSANRRLEILSRPQIRTLDNQLGRINVGRNVPVINGFTTNGLAGQITPTVTRDDSGIILEVTPRITPDDRIVMQIGAERSDYDLENGVTLTSGGVGGDIQAPVKNITRAVSTIAVANEQTIVLGGLIQKTDTVAERKVPWLGDVPVLGHAFRYDSKASKRTELLIFLTPRIVKNDAVNEMLKQIEAERLHFTECEAEAMHGPLFAAPAPPNEGSIPAVYPPQGMWSNPNQNPKAPPLPTPPQPNDGGPQVPPAPPMSDEPNNEVKGAIYEEMSGRSSATARLQQVGATKSSKKSTVLDTFRRKEAQR